MIVFHKLYNLDHEVKDAVLEMLILNYKGKNTFIQSYLQVLFLFESYIALNNEV